MAPRTMPVAPRAILDPSIARVERPEPAPVRVEDIAVD
jgi:hypothetical protein